MSCTFDAGRGMTVCQDVNPPKPTSPSCVPPLIWTCTAPAACACTAPSATTCTLTITYANEDPAIPVMAPLPAGCDAASAELAIAVILAKLLGGV